MWLVYSFGGHRLALNSHSWVSDEGLKRIGKKWELYSMQVKTNMNNGML